ncbi:MAG TPA: LLM class flavin-dependent oxidoreductase [Bacteroidales bacterium]|nr:LLM class flavin-dependent oxidoreductase [Bacteroidales bacterium]
MKTKPIYYSLLELATVSAGSSARESFNHALDLAKKAEKDGYKRIWLAEHHNMLSIASSATAVLIGHIAAGTDHIRVGSGGIMLPNHSPLIVAEQFATLASLYPDRIDLGLGRAPGTDQVTAHAIRSDRMHSVFQFPEEVAQIQTYFSTGNATAKVRVPFAEGLKVPLYILGSSTDSAHVAAEKGLPYAFASHFAPAQLHQAFAIYSQKFKPSHQSKVPYKIGGINVIAAETNEMAAELATSLLQLMISVISGKPDYVQPPAAVSEYIKSLFSHPALDAMMRYTFIGDKATVKQKTEELLKATDVDEIMVVSHIYDHHDRLKSYHIFAEIMQEINRERADRN